MIVKSEAGKTNNTETRCPACLAPPGALGCSSCCAHSGPAKRVQVTLSALLKEFDGRQRDHDPRARGVRILACLPHNQAVRDLAKHLETLGGTWHPGSRIVKWPGGSWVCATTADRADEYTRGLRVDVLVGMSTDPWGSLGYHGLRMMVSAAEAPAFWGTRSLDQKVAGMVREMAYRGRAGVFAREWDGQFVEWRESGNVTPTAVERGLAESRADTGFRPVVMAGTPFRESGLLYGAAQVAAERFGQPSALTISMGTIRIGEHDVNCQVRRYGDGRMEVTFPAHPAVCVSQMDRYEVTIGGDEVTGIVLSGEVDDGPFDHPNPTVRLALREVPAARPVAGARLDVMVADDVAPTFAVLRAVHSVPRPSRWAYVSGSFTGIRVIVFVASDAVGRHVRSRLAEAGGVVDGAVLKWPDGSTVRVVTRDAPGMRADVVIGSDRGKPVQWMFSDPWSLGVHVPGDGWEAFFGLGQSTVQPSERASRLPEWTDGMVRQLHATRKALAGQTSEAQMLTKALRAALPDVDRIPWDLVDRKPLHAAAHALCEMAEAATDGGANGAALRPMLGEMLGILRAAEHLPPATARQMAERTLEAARKAWPRGKK